MPTLEEIIESKKANALAVVQQIQNQQITDYLVPSSELRFSVESDDLFGNPKLKIALSANRATMHKNAIQQTAEKLNIPKQFTDHLLANPRTHKLLVDNLNTLAQEQAKKTYLVRTVDSSSKAMALLSDNYKRIDTRPILDEFMGVCTELGLIPLDGYALETKSALRVIKPKVYYPFGSNSPLESYIYGFQWSTSDFGACSLQGQFFMMRLACTNGMVRENLLREVHLGSKLTNFEAYTERTLELQTKASISALTDVLRYSLSERSIDAYNLRLHNAHNTEVKIPQVAKLLSGLPKNDVTQITQLYQSPDVVNMPKGTNLYRLSNAVSFFAQTERFSRDKQLELETVAGQLLDRVK